jgi:uncharacterized protein
MCNTSHINSKPVNLEMLKAEIAYNCTFLLGRSLRGYLIQIWCEILHLIQSLDDQFLLELALAEMIRDEDYKAVQILIILGANVNVGNHRGTPLSQAAFQGSLNIVSLLLDYGADINFCSSFFGYKSPLMLATQERHLAVVKKLVESGADANSISLESGEFALQIAAACGYKEIFDYLKSLTSNELRKETKETLKRGIQQLQIEEIADSDIVLLTSAIHKNDTYKYREIILRQPNLNSFNDLGSTPLRVAILNRNYNALEELLKNGADPNIGDVEKCQTPLIEAIGTYESSLAFCLLLINSGADINAQTNGGFTALMQAAKYGNIEIVKLLVSAGAELEIRDVDDKTALDYACEYQHEGFLADSSYHENLIEILQFS